MPLTGELEHLPIVDVIQLIHSTRKSGTLNVYSRKGEGQLVFNNGYIVSATHSSEKLKIGKILLETHIINQEELDKALELQEMAGRERKPLIATLLDHCGLSRDAAYKALETLIEMTVVEMISWTRGIFTLDVDDIKVADDYQYLPRQLQTVSLDTQMVLMDALRIFDEKVHAGEIDLSETDEKESQDTTPEDANSDSKDNMTMDQDDGGIVVSEDILGLADLDKLERKTPRVFQGLEAFDPAEIHRQVITRTLPELNDNNIANLVGYLNNISTPYMGDSGLHGATARSQAVIIYSVDDFLQHALMTVCKKEGILVFVTDNAQELDNLIERARFKYLEPLLVFAAPDDNLPGFSKKDMTGIRSLKMAQFPQMSIIQLVSPLDFTFSLQSLNDGVRAVFPTPFYHERQETFAEDMINFLNTFQAYIRSCFNEERRQQFARLRNSLSGLRLLRKAPDISLLVLQFVSEIFPRCLTLIVNKNQLIAERSVGIRSDHELGPSAPLNQNLPIRKDSEFQSVIDSGEMFYGKSSDRSFADLLYPMIGVPADPTLLLLPLKSNERVITMTYADFGAQEPHKVSLDFLEFFAGQAGIAMENALFRRKLDSSGKADMKL